MTPELENFAKINFLRSTDAADLKHITLCTTRPDLKINNEPITVHWISPQDKDNAHTWNHDDFDYTINPLGFREDTALPSTVDVAAFGCSFTFGQGLPKSMLWHNLLAAELNMSVYNFGQPAIGIKGITDLFCAVSNHVSIKHAVFLLPPYVRLQIAAKHKTSENISVVSLIPNYVSNLEVKYNLSGKEIYGALPDEELLKNLRDNICLIDFVAKQKNINVYFSSWDYTTYHFIKSMDIDTLLPEWSAAWLPGVDYTRDLNKNFARDNYHPGPRYHLKWSNQIKDMIK